MFSVNDEVVHRRFRNSPVMVTLAGASHGGYVSCAWFDSAGVYRQQDFKELDLKLVRAAGAPGNTTEWARPPLDGTTRPLNEVSLPCDTEPPE